MRSEEEKKLKLGTIFVSMLVVFTALAVIVPVAVMADGNLPYYDIEQDSLGNYHKAFIDNITGNYEIYYTNDINGSFPQDWNQPIQITYTTTESMLLDLGIYLSTDTMFIIWKELTNFTFTEYETYYTISRDYGTNWSEPKRSFETINLKFDEFDPLNEEPSLPNLTATWGNPYAYYIVQWKTPLIQEWFDGITGIGGIFCGPISHNAQIVWMTPQVKDQVEQLPFIRWIGDFHPLYKIDSNLNNKAGTLDLYVAVIEETGGQINLDKVKQDIVNLRGTIIFNGTGNYIIRTQIDASKIEAISYIHEVEWIGEVLEYMSAMNNVRSYTGTNYVHNSPEDFEGNGIIGGVIDNGFDQHHGDYQSRILATDPVNIQDQAHGTCSYGIVFGDGTGNPTAEGMLPSGQGVFTDAMVYENDPLTAFGNLVTNHQGVFQVGTYGHGYTDTYGPSSIQIDQAVFDYDRTRIQAIGNDASRGMFEEAIATNAITVGRINHQNTATYDDDNVGAYPPLEPAPPSDGPTTDNRIKPDLIRPYDNVLTTDSVDGDGQDGYWWGNYFPGYGGTSASAPVVAGAAGLVYEMYQANHFGNNPSGNVPHASTVKALLIANAHQYDLTTATRNQQGWGSVDIGRIYDVGDKHFIVDEDVALTQGQKVQYTFNFQNMMGPMKITLTWTDPPGTLANGEAVDNKLQLEALGPNGWSEYYLPHQLQHSLWSLPEQMPPYHEFDNNVKNIFIENPTEGTWTLTVSAYEINKDGDTSTTGTLDQRFSLIVTHRPPKKVHLYQGWNLISLPLIQTDTTTQVVLRSIDGYYWPSEIDAWDNQNQNWVHGPTDLDHYMGFWIRIFNIPEIDLIVYGDDITTDQDIELYWGWNLVGYPSQDPIERDIAIQPWSVPDPIGVIQWYDASVSQWHNLLQGEYFELGRGYWMYYYGDPGRPSITWTVPHEAP